MALKTLIHTVYCNWSLKILGPPQGTESTLGGFMVEPFGIPGSF